MSFALKTRASNAGGLSESVAMSWENRARPQGALTPAASDHLRCLRTKGADGIMPPSKIDHTTPCRLDDCDRPVRTRGYCGMHYARTLRDIPLDVPPRIIGDLDARFWSKVNGGDYRDCWLWTASLNDGGYGQFAIDNRPHRAHRVAYELLVGDIPEGLYLDHLCRTKACVNPWHLEPVTNAVNVRRGYLYTPPRIPITVCKHGHEFTPENTRRDRDGHRRCRTCERTQSLAGYYRRKARMEGAA